MNIEQISHYGLILVILSLFIERALSLLFENYWYIKHFDAKHSKEIIAFLVSFLVCVQWSFDILGIFFGVPPTFLGYALTAGIIAGGSKVSIKLFQDILQIKNRHDGV